MKPVPEPETADIVSLDHDGRGVARIDGKAVFVPGALPGERVLLQRRRRRRRHDEADLLEVLRPAPDRVAPRCRHFGICGGCSLQHLSHESQLAAKGRMVADELARIGGVEPERWLPPLAGPVWGYRRRARLGCKFVDRKGRVLVGFRERGSPYIAELERCEILSAPVDGLLDKLAALVGTLEIRRRVAQIEVAVADDAAALVLRVLDDPQETDLAGLRAFAAAESVEIYLQRGGLETVTPLSPPATALRYALPGLPAGIEFAPTDFIQVNGELNRAMIARAIDLLEPRGGDRLLDLFCGLGNFSLPLAGHVATVTGIEGDAALVARAARNAKRNGVTNACFYAANLALPSADAPWAQQAWDLVLLDPPRAGAREVLPVATACRPRRIVYVSCHPGTLARDAGILVGQHGYRLTAAGIMDMFPHTSHVEAIALFEPSTGQATLRSGPIP
ncbi:MAG TPA: 23S rRNA (uracil(1939)-C(5))-methyltransferase RlmD [Steroidobacteraceae bacterium]|nr:23S rRNA (uracil(1939)-C(5))-methyltransferase RlmD [Steroidobacteraceae bacterium]